MGVFLSKYPKLRTINLVKLVSVKFGVMQQAAWKQLHATCGKLGLQRSFSTSGVPCTSVNFNFTKYFCGQEVFVCSCVGVCLPVGGDRKNFYVNCNVAICLNLTHVTLRTFIFLGLLISQYRTKIGF